jgi:hypothetical protein
MSYQVDLMLIPLRARQVPLRLNTELAPILPSTTFPLTSHEHSTIAGSITLHARIYFVFCLNRSISSNPTPGRPCVRLPSCRVICGPKYVGKILYTVVKPASSGVTGALDGRDGGKAERMRSSGTELRGGTGATMLSCFNCWT